MSEGPDPAALAQSAENDSGHGATAFGYGPGGTDWGCRADRQRTRAEAVGLASDCAQTLANGDRLIEATRVKEKTGNLSNRFTRNFRFR